MEPWHKGVIYFLVSAVSFSPCFLWAFPRQAGEATVPLCVCVCTFIWFRFISWRLRSWEQRELWPEVRSDSGGCFRWFKVAEITWSEWCLSKLKQILLNCFEYFFIAFQHLSIFRGPMWILPCGICPVRWHGFLWLDLTAGKPVQCNTGRTWGMRRNSDGRKKKGKQQNFQNRMGEIACMLNLHVHSWMSCISVCAKNSLWAGDASPLWCLACGFLVKAVKQHSIT